MNKTKETFIAKLLKVRLYGQTVLSENVFNIGPTSAVFCCFIFVICQTKSICCDSGLLSSLFQLSVVYSAWLWSQRRSDRRSAGASRLALDAMQQTIHPQLSTVLGTTELFLALLRKSHQAYAARSRAVVIAA